MISNGDSKGLQPHREAASAEHRGHAAPFELLEHPADIRLRARGATLAEVFANAAHGMMAYLFELGEAKPERWERIEITASDREALLVDYVVDITYHDQNIGKAIALAHGADQLFIEAPFLEIDAGIATETRHLTARQAGEIARRAGVARLVTFHFSARYRNREDELRREAEAAFHADRDSRERARSDQGIS